MPAPTTVELLWGTRRQSTRGPKPSLSLDGIVGEAIALADADGLANLSMQRLAERLGYTKMSLYRYVPGKAELTALMLDAAMGTPPELETTKTDSPEAPWRRRLRDWAQALFNRYLTHPWTLDLVSGVRPFGPNEVAWLEAALIAFADTGVTGAERLDAVVLLNGHLRSLAQLTQDETQLEEQLIGQFTRVLAGAGDRYPQTIAAMADTAGTRDDALNFGIDRILDGLDVLIADRADR